MNESHQSGADELEQKIRAVLNRKIESEADVHAVHSALVGVGGLLGNMRNAGVPWEVKGELWLQAAKWIEDVRQRTRSGHFPCLDLTNKQDANRFSTFVPCSSCGGSGGRFRRGSETGNSSVRVGDCEVCWGTKGRRSPMPFDERAKWITKNSLEQLDNCSAYWRREASDIDNYLSNLRAERRALRRRITAWIVFCTLGATVALVIWWSRS